METKKCTQCEKVFEITVDEVAFYGKMRTPVPSVCSDCRFRQKAMWRNETTLYSGRACGLCGKSIISMYHPKSPYVTYCQTCFYGEGWDPKSYGMDYDFNRPFFDQFGELLLAVPKMATYITTGDGPNIGSEYVNMASGCKNSYLVFNTSMVEDVLYSRGLRGVKDSADLYFGTELERCYECVNVQKSAGIIWGQNIVGSVDSILCKNGSGLMNCFGCVNLRNKSFCFFNKQLEPEEYKKRVSEIMGSYTKLEQAKKQFELFAKTFPERENTNIKTVDCTGDYLFTCKNVKHSYEATKSEDCWYLFASKEIKDSLGTIGYGAKAEQILECVAVGYTSFAIGTYGAENCRNILYSFYCHHSTEMIGCESIRHGKYMILNKEYEKEEYEKIKAHIIAELTALGVYGLMIPSHLSPFGYNETIGQDNMPLTKEAAGRLGFKWQDELQITKGKETLAPTNIPDDIVDVSDEITGEVLVCTCCERNYKITAQELFFYRKMILPIPRSCFYCRHKDRLARRGEYAFHDRDCGHCGAHMVTSFPAVSDDIVYCEKCYQQEVL